MRNEDVGFFEVPFNFTLESTNEKLTPRTGVAVFGEYLKGMGFENLCNTHIPNSSHHKAYNPFEFIYPLILMLHSGGRVLDDHQRDTNR